MSRSYARPEAAVEDSNRIGIQALAAEESEAAARSLARAFRDNPLNLAVIGGTQRRRYRTNLHGMRVLLAAGRASALTLSASRASPDPQGVLVAVPPSCYPLPPAPLGLQLRAALGQGPRILRRWGTVYARLDEVHPLETHWYLGVLGVDPPLQRRGLGAALLLRWLGRVDEDGLPSYLETDREENLAFYSEAGFEVSRELRVLGVPVWCMRRAARQVRD